VKKKRSGRKEEVEEVEGREKGKEEKEKKGGRVKIRGREIRGKGEEEGEKRKKLKYHI